MKKFFGVLACLTCLSAPLTCSALIANPDPGTYAADDGSTIYVPGTDVYFFEAFDVFPLLGVPAEFGFYSAASPASKATVFDSADQGPPDQLAWANFPAGGVVDLDSAVLQSLFAPGLGPVGFYLALTLPTGVLNVYSDPALNGGFDLMAAFPYLAVPNAYLLGFELPDGAGGLATVYFAAVNGIAPLLAVPEPGSVALVLLAMLVAMSAVARRRRR